MANIGLTISLDATKAINDAGKLGAELVQANINGTNITVGNPQQVHAVVNQAQYLNQILKSILISSQKLNISLAKTGKLMAQAQPHNYSSSQVAEFDKIIESSQKAIQQIQYGFVPTVKNIAPAADQAASAVTKTGEKATAAATKSTRSWSGFFKQTKQGIRTFEALSRSLFSPITVAILAFEAVVKTFTYFWNNLTQSIDKMTTRSQSAIKAIQQTRKKVEEKTKAATQLIKKLQELNDVQELSIDQQRLAQSIVNKLNRQYKDLNITIDQTTGKYQNLYEAQIKIDQENRKSQANALRGQINAQRDIVNAALANTFGRGISLDKNINGSDFFSLAENLGGTLGSQNADLLARKWNTKDLQQQLQVIDQLIQGLSSSDTVIKNAPEAREALATLIDYKRQLQDLNSVDTQIIDANNRLAQSFNKQAEAIKNTRDQIAELTKQYEDQQRENSLAGLDPEDRANALRAEVEQLEKRNDSLLKAKELGQSQAKSVKDRADMSRQMLTDVQNALRTSQNEVNKKAEQLNKQRKELSKLVTEYESTTTSNSFGSPSVAEHQARQRRRVLEKQIEKAKAAELKLSSQLNDLEKQRDGWRKRAEDFELQHEKNQSQNLKYEQGIANIEKQRQQNLNAIQTKQQQIAEIEKQIQEERARAAAQEADNLQKQADAIDGIYKSYQKQLEAYNKDPFQLKLEDALANAQKAKGADLTRQQIDQITFYVTQLEKMIQLEKQREQIKRQQQAIEELFTNYQNTQTEQYLKLVGQQKQSLLLEAKINAEKAKGAKLTEEELQALKNYVEVDSLLSEFREGQKLNIGKQSVITNDIARKGGWASSVVVDHAQDINKQILDVQKTQVSLMDKINETMKTSNELLKQFSVIQ